MGRQHRNPIAALTAFAPPAPKSSAPVPRPAAPPEPGLVPLRAPAGVSSACVSRAYVPDQAGVFWVLPEDEETLVTRHGFERG